MRSILYAVQGRIHAKIAHLTSKRMSNPSANMVLGFVVGGFLLTMAPDALAAGGMPWEQILCKIANSLAGPTAKAVALIAVVISGFLLAFAEVGGIFKMAMGLIFGLSMALLASRWVGFISGDGSASCLA